jgi:hypothetical protein
METDVCICTEIYPGYDGTLREHVERAALCQSRNRYGDQCEKEPHEGTEHTAGNGGIRWQDRPPPRPAATEIPKRRVRNHYGARW